MTATVTQNQVLAELAEKFNKSEIKQIMFDFGIDYEDISGSTKRDKAREFVLYMVRRNSLQELYNEMVRRRSTNMTPATTIA